MPYTTLRRHEIVWNVLYYTFAAGTAALTMFVVWAVLFA